MTVKEAIQTMCVEWSHSYVYRGSAAQCLGHPSKTELSAWLDEDAECIYWEKGGYAYLQVADGSAHDPNRQWGPYPVSLWLLPVMILPDFDNDDVVGLVEAEYARGVVYVDGFGYDITKVCLSDGEVLWSAELALDNMFMPDVVNRPGAVAAAVDAGIIRVLSPDGSGVGPEGSASGHVAVHDHSLRDLQPDEAYSPHSDWCVRVGTIYHRWCATSLYEETTARSVISRSQQCVDFASAQLAEDINLGVISIDYLPDVESLQAHLAKVTGGAEVLASAAYTRCRHIITTDVRSALVIPHEWSWCMFHELFHHIWHNCLSGEQQQVLQEDCSRAQEELAQIVGTIRHAQPRELLADVFADFCCTPRARQIVQCGVLNSLLSPESICAGMRTRIGKRLDEWCDRHGFTPPGDCHSPSSEG